MYDDEDDNDDDRGVSGVASSSFIVSMGRL